MVSMYDSCGVRVSDSIFGLPLDPAYLLESITQLLLGLLKDRVQGTFVLHSFLSELLSLVQLVLECQRVLIIGHASAPSLLSMLSRLTLVPARCLALSNCCETLRFKSWVLIKSDLDFSNFPSNIFNCANKPSNRSLSPSYNVLAESNNVEDESLTSRHFFKRAISASSSPCFLSA